MIRSERARAIGAWAGTVGLGIAVGPIAGGLLLSHFWWGSIFLVNVPIACFGIVGAVLLVPESKNPHVNRPDPVGAVLSIVGLGLLLWSIIEGPTHGWSSGTVLGVGFASLVVLAGFVAWESRCTHPMLNLKFFRDRSFSVALAAECLGVFGLMGALFLSTQFLQFDLGLSPLAAGIRILPIAATVIASAAVSPFAARLIGVKFTVAAALLLITAGLWQVSAVSGFETTYGDVVLGLVLIGLGAGLMLPTATNSVIGSVPQGDSGIGSATNTVALQVGGALGVAVIGSIMLTRYQDHMNAVLSGRRVPTPVAQTILGSLGGALTVAARAGGSTGDPVGTCGANGVHEWQRSVARRRWRRVPRRCDPGAGWSALSEGAVTLVRRTRTPAWSAKVDAPDCLRAVSDEATPPRTRPRRPVV